MELGLPQRFEEGLGYLIHQLMYAFRQGFMREALALGHPITPEEMATLLILNQDGGLKPTELAEKLAKDKAVITRMLNKLDGIGFVERHPDPQDRRVARAHLTDRGQQAFDQLLPVLDRVIRRGLRDVDDNEFLTTCKVLRQIMTNLKQSATSDA